MIPSWTTRTATPSAWPSWPPCATTTAAPSCRTTGSVRPSPSLTSWDMCEYGDCIGITLEWAGGMQIYDYGCQNLDNGTVQHPAFYSSSQWALSFSCIAWNESSDIISLCGGGRGRGLYFITGTCPACCLVLGHQSFIVISVSVRERAVINSRLIHCCQDEYAS